MPRRLQLMKGRSPYSPYLFALLACLMISTGTRAQYRWHMTLPGVTAGKYQYDFTSLDCAGEVCTAAALRMDTSLGPIKLDSSTGSFIGPYAIMFYRSLDGGLTWSEQDPGLPTDILPNRFVQKIQQIDSLNAVVIGDSGLIVRTFDGGLTWQKQNLPLTSQPPNSSYRVFDVHFSDPATGIVTQSNGKIFTTHDGGNHWDLAPFSHLFAWSCHSDRGDRFRVVSYWTGPVYSTADNWQTVDSTPRIIPIDDTIHSLFSVNFRGEDTIVGFGAQNNGPGELNVFDKPSYITKSVDGGYHWMPITLPDTLVEDLHCMSSLDRDVVFLGGLTGKRRILISVDHGMEWEVDTLLQDTINPLAILSLAVTGDGHCLGIFAASPPAISAPSFVARLEKVNLGVTGSALPTPKAIFYPNPATASLKITLVSERSQMRLLDVMGREALSGFIPADGTLTLDVSQLPRGIYSVMIERDGQMIPAGKVALIGK
ncbi:MAG: YCF48-related protein [Bacteroidota bacterium]|nr:YCF48-related protein [Bacteroidota bacterium]MDP4234525.1 YCF48-related protein [Bacteroidota bacterium]MDP4242590.1 YCF48-related protein [Bacteroidota bacterium]MDP4289418.1 YCF48-related protein [Bacteroidota bacterium]